MDWNSVMSEVDKLEWKNEQNISQTRSHTLFHKPQPINFDNFFIRFWALLQTNMFKVHHEHRSLESVPCFLRFRNSRKLTLPLNILLPPTKRRECVEG